MHMSPAVPAVPLLWPAQPWSHAAFVAPLLTACQPRRERSTAACLGFLTKTQHFVFSAQVRPLPLFPPRSQLHRKQTVLC